MNELLVTLFDPTSTYFINHIYLLHINLQVLK